MDLLGCSEWFAIVYWMLVSALLWAFADYIGQISHQRLILRVRDLFKSLILSMSNINEQCLT